MAKEQTGSSNPSGFKLKIGNESVGVSMVAENANKRLVENLEPFAGDNSSVNGDIKPKISNLIDALKVNKANELLNKTMGSDWESGNNYGNKIRKNLRRMRIKTMNQNNEAAIQSLTRFNVIKLIIKVLEDQFGKQPPAPPKTIKNKSQDLNTAMSELMKVLAVEIKNNNKGGKDAVKEAEKAAEKEAAEREAAVAAEEEEEEEAAAEAGAALSTGGGEGEVPEEIFQNPKPESINNVMRNFKRNSLGSFNMSRFSKFNQNTLKRLNLSPLPPEKVNALEKMQSS